MIITTHKQFPNYKRYEIEYEGRPLVMETGKLAELCNSAVLVSYGETTVLVTCTASARPKDGVDYFPLSVDFNEKLYAVGRIPGSFMRREGKPSLPAVLASRLIDRPMRPLFPSDLRNDVIIACEVLSVDRDCSPEITAMIGASAAVSISDVPFNGPIAGIVLGWDGEKYLFNPTQEQRKTNRMTTTIAATHKKIVMIESEADQVPDDVMYEGIVQAHEHLQPVLDLIDKMVSEIGKPKFEYEHASFDEDLFELLCANEMEGMEYCMDTDDKNVREARVNEWIAAVQEKYETEHPDMMQYMDEILYKMQKKIVKKWLLAGHRVDGRKMNEIRPLDAEVGACTARACSPAARRRCCPSPRSPRCPCPRSSTPSGKRKKSASCTTTTCRRIPPATPAPPAAPTAASTATARSLRRRCSALSRRSRSSRMPSVWCPRCSRPTVPHRRAPSAAPRSRSWTPACPSRRPSPASPAV